VIEEMAPPLKAYGGIAAEAHVYTPSWAMSPPAHQAAPMQMSEKVVTKAAVQAESAVEKPWHRSPGRSYHRPNPPPSRNGIKFKTFERSRFHHGNVLGGGPTRPP